MASRLTTTTGVVLAVVLLFAVNILGHQMLNPVRIDLTENRLFTLSEGTRGILERLEEPVTLRYYISRRELERVPGIGGYADRVRALLGEYKRLSGGMLSLQVIDPEPFSEEEDRAVGYGLRGVPLGLDEGIFYFGLAGTNSVDDEEVIPFFASEREQFLEYGRDQARPQPLEPEAENRGPAELAADRRPGAGRCRQRWAEWVRRPGWSSTRYSSSSSSRRCIRGSRRSPRSSTS